MRTKLLASGALLAFSLIGAAGYGIGTSLANSNKTAPTSCLEALDHAETVINLAAEGMSHAGDAFAAAADFNTAGMKRAGDGMERVGEEVDALSGGYIDASNKCRGN